jgi:hypothetical protein
MTSNTLDESQTQVAWRPDYWAQNENTLPRGLPKPDSSWWRDHAARLHKWPHAIRRIFLRPLPKDRRRLGNDDWFALAIFLLGNGVHPLVIRRWFRYKYPMKRSHRVELDVLLYTFAKDILDGPSSYRTYKRYWYMDTTEGKSLSLTVRHPRLRRFTLRVLLDTLHQL